MKRIIATAVLLAVCACSACLAGGVWVSLSTETETVNAGGELTMRLNMGAWSSTPGVFMLKLEYDKAALELIAADSTAQFECIADENGSAVYLLGLPLASIRADTETQLLTLTFKALKQGETAVIPTILAVTDADWQQMDAEAFPITLYIN